MRLNTELEETLQEPRREKRELERELSELQDSEAEELLGRS
jgi:hypothetical protein